MSEVFFVKIRLLLRIVFSAVLLGKSRFYRGVVIDFAAVFLRGQHNAHYGEREHLIPLKKYQVLTTEITVEIIQQLIECICYWNKTYCHVNRTTSKFKCIKAGSTIISLQNF